MAVESLDSIFESLAVAARRELPILQPAPKDCRSCGACCEHFTEINVLSDDENLEWLKTWNLVEPCASGGYQMKQIDGRCIAFTGEVGKEAACSIYAHRPEGCEVFEAGGQRCRTIIFMDIIRDGKSLFTDDPMSWPS